MALGSIYTSISNYFTHPAASSQTVARPAAPSATPAPEQHPADERTQDRYTPSNPDDAFLKNCQRSYELGGGIAPIKY